ncbi:glycosyltransferase [Paenibacillus sp. RC84]|uniref:glycosyltransferase n=1 Tax=Paenibacillus sp. RC84 TaxID=3156252 RepID=UPI003516D2BD
MNARRIMLFSHLCSRQHITGAEKLLLFMVRELKERHDCILVVPGEGVLSREARAAGIYTLVVPFPLVWEVYTPDAGLTGQLDGLPVTEPGALVELLRVLGQYRPDLVISNTCVNVLPPVAAKALGIPVLWMITEKMTDTAFTPVSTEFIHRHADLVAGISEATLVPFGVREAESQIVMYPSWHEETMESGDWSVLRERRRAGSGIGSGEVLAGYIASDIYPLKGLDHFIGAALELCPAYPHVHYLIAGKPTDSAFYRQCRNLTVQSGYGGRFHWTAFEKEVASLYTAMDFVVVPSLTEEGFGMTALEGMMFGKPVIAFDSGGLREILGHTGNARFLVPRGDTRTLAARMRELVEDPLLRMQTGEANLSAVRSVFGIEAYRSRQEQLLARLENKLAVRQNNPQPQVPPVLGGVPGPLVIVRGVRPDFYLLRDGIRYPVTEAQRLRLGAGVVQVPEGLLASRPVGTVLSFPDEAAPPPWTGAKPARRKGVRAARKRRSGAKPARRKGVRAARKRRPGAKPARRKGVRAGRKRRSGAKPARRKGVRAGRKRRSGAKPARRKGVRAGRKRRSGAKPARSKSVRAAA